MKDKRARVSSSATTVKGGRAHCAAPPRTRGERPARMVCCALTLCRSWGTPSRVSEVLNGKRDLSMSMVRKLRERFDTSADLLIAPRPSRGLAP